VLKPESIPSWKRAVVPAPLRAVEAIRSSSWLLGDTIALKFDRERMVIELDEECTEAIREAWTFQ
jgi:hypothetical protein